MIIIKEVIIFLEANDFKINVNGFINNDEIILYRIGKHNVLGLTENINLSCIIN